MKLQPYQKAFLTSLSKSGKSRTLAVWGIVWQRKVARKAFHIAKKHTHENHDR